MVTLTSIEIGHQFLTVWGTQYPEIKNLAATVYPKLPPEVQALNPPDLWHHAPAIYHPYGQGLKIGRKFHKHFHIIYPKPPGDKEVNELKSILNRPNLVVECLEDHVNPALNIRECYKVSRQYLNEHLRTLDSGVSN